MGGRGGNSMSASRMKEKLKRQLAEMYSRGGVPSYFAGDPKAVYEAMDDVYPDVPAGAVVRTWEGNGLNIMWGDGGTSRVGGASGASSKKAVSGAIKWAYLGRKKQGR